MVQSSSSIVQCLTPFSYNLFRIQYIRNLQESKVKFLFFIFFLFLYNFSISVYTTNSPQGDDTKTHPSLQTTKEKVEILYPPLFEGV